MSTPTVLNNATIWLGGYDLTGASNEITFNAARADLNSSRFGDSVDAVHPGAMQVDAEVKGYFDSSLDGPLVTQLQSPSAAWPLTICPDGGDEGEVAYGIQAYNFGYAVFETGWGESLPYRLSAKSKSKDTGASTAASGLERGLVAVPKATRSATYEGTKYQLGAVSASQMLLVSLHAFSITGAGPWSAVIYSDVDAAAGGETPRNSFPNITTAPGRYVRRVLGPVTDTYWRITIAENGGGTLTAAVTYAIVDA